MKKRIFSLLTSLIMVISLVSVLPMMTAGAETSGVYEYEILDDGTVEIIEFLGSASKLTIPSTIDGKKVTRIGNRAFRSCTRLTSITIPDSVTSIGVSAFHGCESLTSITIPNSVTSIGDDAFYDCDSLTSVTIGNSVTSIGVDAFSDCTSLTSVTIGNSVTSVGKGAFYDCYSLTSVTIPKSVTSIGYKAFGYNYDESTGDVTIPDFMIKCYSGTAGEKYAIDNGFSYELLESSKIAKVTGFKVTATSAQAVKLTWNKVNGATGYVVYRAISGKWVRVGVVKTNSFYEGKLKSGTSYRYAVKAYKTVNDKNYYSPSYPTLWTSTNPATVNFTLTAGSKKAVVKWSKVTGATGYKVYYKTSAKGKWVGLKTTTGTSYTKTGLTKGKTYYFTVKAYRTVNGKTYNGAFVTKSVKVK